MTESEAYKAAIGAVIDSKDLASDLDVQLEVLDTLITQWRIAIRVEESKRGVSNG
jgi:hypothetical protein